MHTQFGMLGREKEGVINMKRDQIIVIRLIKDEKNLSIGIKKSLKQMEKICIKKTANAVFLNIFLKMNEQESLV